MVAIIFTAKMLRAVRFRSATQHFFAKEGKAFLTYGSHFLLFSDSTQSGMHVRSSFPTWVLDLCVNKESIKISEIDSYTVGMISEIAYHYVPDADFVRFNDYLS